jgi:hypothetical protein
MMMRKIDLRIPAVAGLAVLLLAFAPGAKAAEGDMIQFVPGTGAAAAMHEAAAPRAFASNEKADHDAQAELNKISQDLADPRMQDGVAAMVERMGDTMMRLPVGKFAAAVEKARPGTMKKRIREDATIADLAGRDAERLPEALGKGSKQMMGMLSGFAAAFATMVPEFEELGRDLEESMAEIKASRR